jgi:hypothetical protein
LNIYLVVEDTYGTQVYSKWAKYINPRFSFIQDIRDVKENNIYVVSGNGYPNYYDIIEDAMNDVNSNNLFDRLVVAVDSEDQTFREKFDEVDSYIKSKNFKKDYKIIIQHFCLETWALGNRAIVSRTPQSENLRRYLSIFNVLTSDPELLPDYKIEELNRAQFAEKYLRMLLNEKYRNLTYTKKNPHVLLNYKYFDRVRARLKDTEHIKSFEDFLTAFT